MNKNEIPDNGVPDIVPKVRQLLTSVDIADNKIIFGNTVSSTVRLRFAVQWFFVLFSKDSVCKTGAAVSAAPASENGAASEEVILNEEQLSAFEAEHRQALTTGTQIKRPFCHSLEGMTPKEIFALGNQVNRISTRTAKGRCNCPDCHGSKMVNCVTCSGYGMILCPSCQGREGGCQRCSMSGFIDCPSCRKQKKLPCKKCKSSGVVTIERRVGLLAKAVPKLTVEFDRAADAIELPEIKIQNECYDDILADVDFRLTFADFSDSNCFKLEYKGFTTVNYVNFCIAGQNTTYNFVVCGEKFRPMAIPSILDDKYAELSARLKEVAVKGGALHIEDKISLFRALASDRFFHALLKNYETNFEQVTKRLRLEAASNNAYSSRRVTMRNKLESMVAVRKDELSELMAQKLVSASKLLMSHDFAKETCFSMIEFIYSLKYRSKRVARSWDFVTLGVWFITLLCMIFAINPATMLTCVVIALVSAVVNSYIGTKVLKLYEAIRYSRTLSKISRFIDFNYEVMRSLVMIAGVIIIEFVVLNLK